MIECDFTIVTASIFIIYIIQIQAKMSSVLARPLQDVLLGRQLQVAAFSALTGQNGAGEQMITR